MEKHEHLHKNRVEIFINNFLGGIAWALGATVGLAIVFAILGFVLANVNLIPFVGNFVADIVEFVVNKNPQILQNTVPVQ